VIGIAEQPNRTGPGRRGPQRWVTAGITVLIVGLLVWVIGFSSVLGVRSVRVTGTSLLRAQQIRDAAAVRSGAPLFRLDTGSIARRVAALPEVRSVKVDTSYPSTVTIKVTERVAVGYRPTGGGAALVDQDNVAFRTVAKPPSGLPRLEISNDAARTVAEIQVAAALPVAVTKVVGFISVPTTESITLTLTDGRTILWGGVDRSAEKAHLLQALLSQPGRYFDLSDPESVISR
jgi:cell division protein FtsQ